MMAYGNIIDVSEGDFEYQVLAYSQQIPVVVDFWAEWCIPCRTLGPMLEKLTQEAEGAFRLAKVDVDANPNLAKRYNVHSIPAVKAFRDGKIVSQFSGLIPEPRLREFLRTLAPNEMDLALDKAGSLFKLEQYRSAEAEFRKVLQKSPESPVAQLGLAKCLLIQGGNKEALAIMKTLPPSKEYTTAQSLLPLAQALERLGNGEQWNADPMDAAFNRAISLVGRGNLPAAMDGLLDVLRENKRYRDGEARKVMVSILELLGDDNELARQYRQELSAVLF